MLPTFEFVQAQFPGADPQPQPWPADFCPFMGDDRHPSAWTTQFREFGDAHRGELTRQLTLWDLVEFVFGDAAKKMGVFQEELHAKSVEQVKDFVRRAKQEAEANPEPRSVYFVAMDACRQAAVQLPSVDGKPQRPRFRTWSADDSPEDVTYGAWQGWLRGQKEKNTPRFVQWARVADDERRAWHDRELPADDAVDERLVKELREKGPEMAMAAVPSAGGS